ncbi:hypothetical protein H0E87_023471 [Populus deltoides]|uniref:EGF-like domain-containing protein n=1 Tax=Populus deltoides TaxID=3696 RepID=A0A8T2XE93_POPDE|nr:hypothetical protein H0E87_023471 [Populus deltoides]
MGQKLYSNANGTVDYSTGQYMLELQMDGNVVMSAYKFADPGYWFTLTAGNLSVSLIFNQTTAFMYVVNHTSIRYPMTSQVPTPIGDYYHRATINDHGNLQQFVYHKENGIGWTVVWEPESIKAEPCIPFNICGVYGFCTSIDNTTINCDCLPGYSPWDPSIPSKGCYPDTVIDFCAPNSSASNFTLEEIGNADFPNGEFADMARVTPADVEECRKVIMDDCFAVAGVLVESVCYKKRTPLLNARSSIPSTNNIVAFIKIPKANNNNQIQDKDDDSPSWIALLAGLLLCSIMTLLFATISIYHHPLAQPYISKKQLPVPKPGNEMILIDWVLCNVRAGNLQAIVSHDSEVLEDFFRFERMVLVGLWCICPNPTLRPSMNKVTQMLEGTSEVDVPPLIDAQIF